MEIGKYKQAMSYLLNSNATLKTFVINPEAKLIDNDSKPIEGFEEGGRVGFQLGGLENIQKLSNGKYKFISRRGGVQTSKTFNTLEETIKFRDSYNEKYPKEKAIFKKNYGNKEKLEKLEQTVLESNKDLYNALSKEEAAKRAGYTSAANLSGRKEMTRIFNNLIPIENKISNHFNDILKNIDNIPYQDIVDAGGFNRYLAKPFGTDAIKNSRKVSNVYSRPEFKDLRDMVKTMSNPQVIETYGNKDMYIGEVIDNLDTKKAGQRLKGGSLTDDIIMTADRSVKAGNKDIQFLTKPGSVDASDIVFKWNGKLYGKNIDEYKGKKVNNLTTDLYKLPEFGEYIEARNKLNTLRDKIVNHPVSGEPITIDNLLRETYSKGFENKSFYKSSGLDLDHLNLKDEPFSNLRPLPKHINQTAGLIGKTHSIIEDKNKALSAIGYNIPENALENSILKFSDRVLNKGIPISKTYDVGLRSITGGSKEYLSPESEISTGGLKEGKPTTEDLFKGETQVRTSSGLRPVSEKEPRIPKEFNEQKQTIQNIFEQNPEFVKAARSAGIKCRRDIGGTIDTECLAENFLKETKLLEEGTELQKASSFNKLKNFSKATGMGAIKLLGWVAVPLQINDTYEGYKEGLPLDEVVLKGLLNAEGISQSFKEQFALSPQAREAKQILNPNDNLGMDSMGGMGYIEAPSTMTVQKAEKIYRPEKEAYDKKIEEENIKRILKRGFDPYAKETEPNTGALDDLTDYSYMSAADGGRVGYADGSGPKFTRRGALGLLGALAATPLVKSLMRGEKFAGEAKALKAVKLLPKVSGMPEWFPSLVSRIEKEGKDISIPVKNLEDMIVTKKLEIKVPGKKDPEIITMHKHPNGSIQIEADISGGSFDSPFELHYTPPKSDIDLATGKAINEPGDFNVLEQRPKTDWNGQMEIDYDYFSHEDAISDIERVEKIATGKRIHPKKVEQRTANRKRIENDPMEDVMNRSPGPPDTPDWWEQ
jgi:hypothetical protein